MTYDDPARRKRDALERAEKARAKLSPSDFPRKVHGEFPSSYKPLDIHKPWKPGDPKPGRGRT